MKLAGTLITFLALAGFAAATPAVVAPEIDGNSLASGIALVSGLLMVARGRAKK